MPVGSELCQRGSPVAASKPCWQGQSPTAVPPATTGLPDSSVATAVAPMKPPKAKPSGLAVWRTASASQMSSPSVRSTT